MIIYSDPCLISGGCAFFPLGLEHPRGYHEKCAWYAHIRSFIYDSWSDSLAMMLALILLLQMYTISAIN